MTRLELLLEPIFKRTTRRQKRGGRRARAGRRRRAHAPTESAASSPPPAPGGTPRRSGSSCSRAAAPTWARGARARAQRRPLSPGPLGHGSAMATALPRPRYGATPPRRWLGHGRSSATAKARPWFGHAHGLGYGFNCPVRCSMFASDLTIVFFFCTYVGLFVVCFWPEKRYCLKKQPKFANFTFKWLLSFMNR